MANATRGDILGSRDEISGPYCRRNGYRKNENCQGSLARMTYPKHISSRELGSPVVAANDLEQCMSPEDADKQMNQKSLRIR